MKTDCYCLFEPIYGKYPEESLCEQYPACKGCPYASERED